MPPWAKSSNSARSGPRGSGRPPRRHPRGWKVSPRIEFTARTCSWQLLPHSAHLTASDNGLRRRRPLKREMRVRAEQGPSGSVSQWGEWFPLLIYKTDSVRRDDGNNLNDDSWMFWQNWANVGNVNGLLSPNQSEPANDQTRYAAARWSISCSRFHSD